ncbi:MULTISPECIES: acyltransferase family protein [Bradyrhizobium]|jgi:exopolysaccharide production protein ExoZ|uniref:Acyltransferase n=1 Tax=Bradyrhizobium denitrificans TaxID=2734912 RepID=A0ABS5GAX4_9BRAD|nr:MULTISPECIES: acyltransferase [Bradyrhizobium]MBR1138483.1 acyltransferase [Bradyrhizobium denitrificans]MCL8485536.1 acyltransferase [Bradyrhizobium denitrificans]MDU0957517.1 acyltransferase [Bradyrhizobium sp.]MDU1491065.1 acyltransferase [Bradyrhizobium sp.]MDU1541243.1 acyltransferase [Bradyrhizobium sp.]
MIETGVVREPAGAEKRPDLIGIQMLRGLAASMVVLHHTLEESLASKAAPTSPDWLTTFGASGVDIFFVISGFVMVYASFASERPSIGAGTFLAKRFVRIYPFYWTCLLLILILWGLGFYRKLDPTPGIWLRAVLLLPTDQPVLTVSWTLVYEMYFYMLFAAALFLQWSRHVAVFGITTAIAALLAASLLLGDREDFLSNPIVIEFCMGMLLATAFRRLHVMPAWIGIAAGLSAIVLASLFVPHETTNGLPPAARVVAWGLPALLIVASSLSLKAVGSRLERAMAWLGDCSYAIYLTHPFVMVVFARIVKNQPRLSEMSLLPVVPFVVLICLAAGAAAHVLIERRLLDFGRRLLAPRRSEAALPR